MSKLQKATRLSAHKHHWHHKKSFASFNKKSFTEDGPIDAKKPSVLLVLGNSKSIETRKAQ